MEDWVKSRSPAVKYALKYAEITSEVKRKDEELEAPMIKAYLIVGHGSMLGEEDAVSNSKKYSTNVRCHTIKASVYAIKV